MHVGPDEKYCLSAVKHGDFSLRDEKPKGLSTGDDRLLALPVVPTFVESCNLGWRDHADHHMRMLMSPGGLFATSRDRNSDSDPLSYAAPPAGMFADVRALAGRFDDFLMND